MMSDEKQSLRDWDSLSAQQQIDIRIEYGYYLDSVNPTCSMESKIEQFRRWLEEEKQISYVV